MNYDIIVTPPYFLYTSVFVQYLYTMHIESNKGILAELCLNILPVPKNDAVSLAYKTK